MVPAVSANFLAGWLRQPRLWAAAEIAMPFLIALGLRALSTAVPA